MLRIFKQLITDWCLNKKQTQIGELFDSSAPLDVDIPDHTGNTKFIGEGTTTLLVETPSGYSSVKRVLKTIPYEVHHLALDDGKTLDAADEHIVLTATGEKYVRDLTQGDVVRTISGSSAVASVVNTKVSDHMFDLELNDEEHVYYTNGILSHNTTIAAMYLLWMTNFQEKKEVIIASKNMSHAVSIMARVKAAYDELPHWLKAGAKYDSRTMLEFDNGSKITSEATSENTGRGSSPAAIMLDELAFASRRIQDGMWSSLAPALSTGGQFIVTSTPNGDSDLYAEIWRGAKAGQNSFFPVEAFWDEHPERGPDYLREMMGKLGELKTRQEILGEFLSSDALLINSLMLHKFKAASKPVYEDMGFQFWTNQIGGRGKTYLVGVDPATGNGNDFTVIQIVEFPSLVQVGELRLNSVNLPLIYAKIKWLLKHLRKPDAGRGRAEIMWSFERNGVGEALVALIQNDESPDGGTYIDGVDLYNENPNRFGVYTTGKSKLISCMQLKNLIEKVAGGITINSPHLLFELKNFISSGGSYAAKAGCTDDAVMAMCVVMKLLDRLSQYDERAREIVFESVAPDFDINTPEEPSDHFGDDPVPFGMS